MVQNMEVLCRSLFQSIYEVVIHFSAIIYLSCWQCRC